MGSRKNQPSTATGYLCTYEYLEKEPPITTGFGFRLWIQIEGKQNQPTNKKPCGLDLKKKSLRNDNCVVSLMSNCLSWQGVWDALKLWGCLESRANRCLTLLERCRDAIPEGLCLPLGTRLLIVLQKKKSPSWRPYIQSFSIKKRTGGGKKTNKQKKSSQAEALKKKFKIMHARPMRWVPVFNSDLFGGSCSANSWTKEHSFLFALGEIIVGGQAVTSNRRNEPIFSDGNYWGK